MYRDDGQANLLIRAVKHQPVIIRLPVSISSRAKYWNLIGRQTQAAPRNYVFCCSRLLLLFLLVVCQPISMHKGLEFSKVIQAYL
jgi:hypothetical protein